MANGEAGGYLPGDPRFGLSGEASKDYYRTKAAQWAIYLLGQIKTRRTPGARGWRSRRPTSKGFGERVNGYGHFVSDDGRETLGASSSCSSTTARRPKNSSRPSR